jgi:hypothetical protein
VSPEVLPDKWLRSEANRLLTGLFRVGTPAGELPSDATPLRNTSQPSRKLNKLNRVGWLLLAGSFAFRLVGTIVTGAYVDRHKDRLGERCFVLIAAGANQSQHLTAVQQPAPVCTGAGPCARGSLTGAAGRALPLLGP